MLEKLGDLEKTQTNIHAYDFCKRFHSSLYICSHEQTCKRVRMKPGFVRADYPQAYNYNHCSPAHETFTCLLVRGFPFVEMWADPSPQPGESRQPELDTNLPINQEQSMIFRM